MESHRATGPREGGCGRVAAGEVIRSKGARPIGFMLDQPLRRTTLRRNRPGRRLLAEKIYGRSLVTVLIDTYNHERFVEQAITSVLEQDMSMADVEIVVVDDGSTDRTPEIVRSFEPRVRLIRKPNGGQASAFNIALPQTRGEMVAMLDGDDWWAKQKLRRALETLEANPDVGIVGHGQFESYCDGRPNGLVLPGREYRVDLSRSSGRNCSGTWLGFSAPAR